MCVTSEQLLLLPRMAEGEKASHMQPAFEAWETPVTTASPFLWYSCSYATNWVTSSLAYFSGLLLPHGHNCSLNGEVLSTVLCFA